MPPGRIVVLGGGGVAGIAWLVGLLAGLAREGVHAERADGFIGTSAGSVVGAQLAHGVSLENLLYEQLAPAIGEVARPYSQSDADARNRVLMEKVGGDLGAARRRIGAFALRSETVAPLVRREIIAGRLQSHEWPQRWLGIVAVDTATGEHELFEASSGVPLVDAVAASCAVPGAWPAVEIRARKFMDGGIRSLTNADLARGASQVLVIAPLGWAEGNPVSGHLKAEVAALRGAGAHVDVIVPDARSAEALGDNVLDPARRVPCAHAGLAQGHECARQLSAAWAA
jgi:NTE family protein